MTVCGKPSTLRDAMTSLTVFHHSWANSLAPRAHGKVPYQLSLLFSFR